MAYDENAAALQRDLPYLHTGNDESLTIEKLEEFIELITPQVETTPEWWPDAGRRGTLDHVNDAITQRYAMHKLVSEIIKYLNGHRHEFGEWKEMPYYKGREKQVCSCGQYKIRIIGDNNE